jgi:hypothetical protein
MKRVARIAAVAGVVLVAIVALATLNIGALARFAMTPREPFDLRTAPPAPDYTDPRNWSALPERDDAGDRWPTGSPPVDQVAAAVDVFYVHPTTYVGNAWNAPTDDPALAEATDRVATQIQATAFNACCSVYAPRYRQANGTQFTNPSADGARAFDLAYTDVVRAFEAFQARRGADRPFLLAAHSQGSILAQRLLFEKISGTPLRDQLVAAYLPGGTVTQEGLREAAPDIPPCRTTSDLHCVVAWNARGPEYVTNEFAMARSDRRTLLCTNPLSWQPDGAPMPADRNLGAVFLESDDPSPRLAFADAQCVDGTLVIREIGAAPRDLPSRILDHVLGAGNHHPIEYQIYFMNIRENAAQRVRGVVRSPVN